MTRVRCLVGILVVLVVSACDNDSDHSITTTTTTTTVECRDDRDCEGDCFCQFNSCECFGGTSTTTPTIPMSTTTTLCTGDEDCCDCCYCNIGDGKSHPSFCPGTTTTTIALGE
jgi:hypothetical protein